MADDAERLVVLLEARIRDFEKNMAKASGTATQSFNRMRRESASATAQMERDMVRTTSRINQALAASATKVGAYGKAFVGGLAGALTAGGIMKLTSMLGDAVKQAADLVDLADKVGVDTDSIQEMLYGFNQAGVDAETVEKSLEQWGKRIGEAFTQGGPLAQLFEANNLSLTDGEGKLRSSVDLMRDMADLIKNAGSDQERLALAQLAFGKGGADMVLALKDGAIGMDALMQSARDAGVVMDKDILKRAASLDDKFEEVSAKVSTQLKTALIEVAGTLETIVTLVTKFGDVLEEISGIPAPSWWGLVEGAVGIGGGVNAGAAILMRQKEAQEKAAREAADKGDRVVPGELSTDDFEARFTGKRKQTIVPGRRGGGSSNAPRDRADAYDRLTRSIVAEVAALVSEAEIQRGLNPLVDDYGYAIAKARMARELLTAAEDAGKKVTPELKAEIEALAEQYATATVEAAQLAEQQDQLVDNVGFQRDVLKGALTDLRSAMADGKLEFQELGDIALNVLDKIISRIEDDLLDALFKVGKAGSSGGGGGIFSLLGNLFGGGSFVETGGGFASLIGYADGTADTGGRRGEPRGIVHGREAVIPLPDGGRVPVSVQEPLGGAGGSSVVEIRLSPELIASILSEAEGQSVKITGAGIKQYDKGSLGRFATNMRDYPRRNPT